MTDKSRIRKKSYWNAFSKMVKASTARNTVEIPLFFSITDFENKKILDVGAGTGRLAIKVQGFSNKVTALDENDWALKRLKENIKKQNLQKRIKVVSGSAKKIPFKANSFDITYGLWIMHHYKKDWKKILDEMIRVTKKDGVIITAFSTEKYSIPKLEALTKKNELKLRKEFTQKVRMYLKNKCKEIRIKRGKLPFYFKNPKFCFKVLSETFLPKPLTIKQKEKVINFIEKHYEKEKGVFLAEEIAFVFGIKIN